MSAEPPVDRPPYRVVVVPWLRYPGRLLLRNWLAIAVGPLILTWRTLTARELEHELEHVRQWRRYGALFSVRYLAASLQAYRSGGRWYADNRFEVAARTAADAAERTPPPDAA